MAALGQSESEEMTVAVSSRENEAKGEELVLITTLDVDMQHLRKLLAEAGISNLWIPKICVKVEKIPTLGSGKISLGELRRIAKNSK